MSPLMYDLVKPRGMWTGLITVIGSVRPKTFRRSTASSSAGTPSSRIVRWPTGFMNRVSRSRRRKPSSRPMLVVVLPRFWPVAAR